MSRAFLGAMPTTRDQIIWQRGTEELVIRSGAIEEVRQRLIDHLAPNAPVLSVHCSSLSQPHDVQPAPNPTRNIDHADRLRLGWNDNTPNRDQSIPEATPNLIWGNPLGKWCGHTWP